jgi:tryptophan halogenase
MMSDTIEHIVVVGGGSAGWLVAGVLAAEHPLRVTLVESPAVPAIGVGEGTWPSMRDTLHRIGVSESDFFRECDAAFKQGSRFERWVTGADDDVYFHPFVLPQGYGDANLAGAWQRATAMSLRRPGQLPAAPVRARPRAQAGRHARIRGGRQLRLPPGRRQVRRVPARALREQAGRAPRASTTSRTSARRTTATSPRCSLRGGSVIEGDLFVDCTGMQSLLLGKHYGVPLLHQRHVLFNDSALAVQVPYATERTARSPRRPPPARSRTAGSGTSACRPARHRPRVFERPLQRRGCRARAARLHCGSPAARPTFRRRAS